MPLRIVTSNVSYTLSASKQSLNIEELCRGIPDRGLSNHHGIRPTPRSRKTVLVQIQLGLFFCGMGGGEDAGEEKEANAGNWLRGAKSKNPTIAVFEAKSAPKWLNHAVF